MVQRWRPFDNPTLVGRDRERQQLRACLDAMLGGHGHLVLISGEAGIGKTTFVRDLIREATEQGTLVLSGGCYDLTTTPPYGPLVEAFRGYESQGRQPPLPGWFGNPDEMSGIGSQAALFEEVASFFAAVAARQPLMLVLEDLHWADPASLNALRYLARTLRETAILQVATYRDDEITRRHELYHLLPILVRESQAQRVHLNRLDGDAVQDLVASHYALAEDDQLRLAEHVFQRSEGNPFFAGEILRGLEDEQVLRPLNDGWALGDLERAHVPTVLRQALDARLERLSNETRGALQVAALMGQEAPLDVWRTVTGLGGLELDRVITEALDARLLEESFGRAAFRFRHALFQEALHESVILSRRRSLHRQLGEALEQTARPDPDAVAHHFQQAGDPRSAGWLIRAGVRAEGAYAWSAAARSYEAAQVFLEADPATAQARGWLRFQTGHILRYADAARSLAHLEEAGRIAGTIGDPVLAACSRFFIGLLRCFRSELGAGVAEMGHAVHALEQASSQDQERARQAIASLFPKEIFTHPRVTSGSTLAKIGVLPTVNFLTHTYVIWLVAAGRLHEAVALGESFIASVSAATDDEVLIKDFCRDAYYGLAQAAETLGQPETARRWRTQAIAAYEMVGHHALIAAIHRAELDRLLTYHADQVVERQRVARAAVEAARRAGGAWGYAARVYALPLDLLDGRWDEARDLALQTLDQTSENRSPPAWAIRLPTLGALGRERSEQRLIDVIWADIQALLRDGLATEPGEREYFLSTRAQRLAAELSLDTGDLDQARAWLEMHDRWLSWSGALLGRAEGALLWARFHCITGDPEAARRHAQRALEHASEPRQPLALIAVHRLLGELDTDVGQLEAAASHLQASLDLAEACAAPFEQAQTILALSMLAAKSGDSGRARSLLRDARRICERLDAKRALNLAATIEAGLHQPRRSHPAGLSEREVEVLRLVMEGMSNHEVGEALFISPRTVSQHLRSVYNKLGVNSRAAAVARWADLSRD